MVKSDFKGSSSILLVNLKREITVKLVNYKGNYTKNLLKHGKMLI